MTPAGKYTPKFLFSEGMEECTDIIGQRYSKLLLQKIQYTTNSSETMNQNILEDYVEIPCIPCLGLLLNKSCLELISYNLSSTLSQK